MIWQVISIHIRLLELGSLQFGWHIAGAALTRRKKSIAPQATIFNAYRVMRKPYELGESIAVNLCFFFFIAFISQGKSGTTVNLKQREKETEKEKEKK